MLWAAREAFKYPVLLLNLPCVSTVVKRWRRVRDVDTSWLLRLLFRRQKSHLLNLFGENCSTCTSIQNKTKKQIEYIVLCDSTLALHCVIYLCMYICTGESWESNSDTVESLSLSGRLRLKVVGSGQFWEILIGDVDSLPLLLTLKTTKEDTNETLHPQSHSISIYLWNFGEYSVFSSTTTDLDSEIKGQVRLNDLKTRFRHRSVHVVLVYRPWLCLCWSVSVRDFYF